MGTTPAAHLARLKVTFQAWSISAIESGKGTGYTAQRRIERGGVRSVYAPTLAELEAALAELEGGRHRDESCAPSHLAATAEGELAP